MIDTKTVEKLRAMHLGAMADEFERQMSDPGAAALGFNERLGIVVDIEFSRRVNNRLSRLVKRAELKDPLACIEGIDYDPARNLNAAVIQQLASCAFIEKSLNVQILGPTGSGKTFLACALGNAACRKSYDVKYTRLQDMLGELMVAQAEGTFNKTFGELKNVRLLIVDDWLMFEVTNDAEASILYNLIESRMDKRSMVICSQVDAAGWHKRIANKVAADSICDRLVNSAYKVIVGGEMRRKAAADSLFGP